MTSKRKKKAKPAKKSRKTKKAVSRSEKKPTKKKKAKKTAKKPAAKQRRLLSKSGDPEWERIEDLVDKLGEGQKPARLHFLKRLFDSAIKLAQESPGTLNLKIAATTLKELQLSFRVFYKDRHVPKITLFGSARTSSKDPNYRLAKILGREAVRRKYMIITGGGPGAMAAGNEGAGQGNSFGLNIRLPFEQEANPFIDSSRHLINFKYFYTRKLFLIKEAVALICMPGGFGTFDEAFELLTLLQTGKAPLMPVIFLEAKGYDYWTKFWRTCGREFVKHGFIDEVDLKLFRIFHSPEEAMDHIDHFYSVYHSSRLVGDHLALRLKRTPDPQLMERINREFGFLASDGKIYLSEPLDAESNEPELRGLPRVVFRFDRRDFSSLRLLIDFLNDNTL